MKAKESHKLTDEEIAVELGRLRRRLFELRTQGVSQKIEDTTQFPKTRRDIARLMTEANVRRRAKASA